MTWVSLHNHSHFSFADGIGTAQEYFKKLKDCSLGPGLATTDHGNCNNWLEHFKQSQTFGSKGIYGCELYLAHNVKHLEIEEETGKQKFRKDPTYHALVLAKNEQGVRNLLKLNYKSFAENYYYRPVVLFQDLWDNSEGLIVTSACLGSFLNKLVLQEKEAEAIAILEKFKAIFKQDFYLELQLNELPKQKIVNAKLIEFGQAFQIPLMVSNDVHYLNNSDNLLQDVSKMIGYQKTISSKDLFRTESRSNYLCSRQDLHDFNHNFGYDYSKEFVDSLCDKTLEIAEQCNYSFDTKNFKLPKFQVPANYQSSFLLLKETTGKALKTFIEQKIIPETKAFEYIKRLDYELKIIQSFGFSDYFLIIADMVAWARQNNIGVGTARGSAGGSLLAFLLHITEIDPIKFNLPFERFLNPDRKKLPDIDLDFDVLRKGEVEEYLKQKYGAESVVHLGTIGSWHMKGILRDLVRIFERSLEDLNKIAKIIPDKIPDKFNNNIQLFLEDLFNIILAKTNKNQSDLLYLKWHRDNQDLFHIANGLFNRARQAGSHAAAIVLTDGPIYHHIPVARSSGNLITGFQNGMETKELDDLKLLKIDLLGLKTINVIQETINLVQQRHGTNLKSKVSGYNLDLTDPNIYQFFQNDDGIGIFQFESGGIQKLLKAIQPTQFEDIVACNALYRPATLKSGQAYAFADAKNDANQRPTIHPILTSVLKETYNCVVYQEQLMFLFNTLTNCGLGKADLWRKEAEYGFGITQGFLDLTDLEAEKAKKPKLVKFLNEFQTLFQQKYPNIKTEEYNNILTYILGFSNYLFNKAHCVAYSLIAFQTAYFKHYFPTEFYAALLSFSDDETELEKILISAKNHGIQLLPLDLNLSDITKFIPKDQNSIQLSLKMVKGLGEKSLEQLNALRPIQQPEQLEPVFSKMNKTALVALFSVVGYPPSLGPRKAILEHLGAFKSKLKWLSDPKMEDFNLEQLLELEKQYLGFYLTPILNQENIQEKLEKFKDLLKNYNLSNFANFGPNKLILGQVQEVAIKETKNKKQYLTCKLYDGTIQEEIKAWFPLELKRGQILAAELKHDSQWGYSFRSQKSIIILE